MYVSPAWSGKRLKENQHAKPFLGLAYNTNHSLIERFLSAFAYYVKSRNGASIQCSRHFDACDLQSFFCSAVLVQATYIPIIDQISYHLHLHLMMSPGYCYCREIQSFLALDMYYFQGKSTLRVVGLKYVGSCPRGMPCRRPPDKFYFFVLRSKCHFHRESMLFSKMGYLGSTTLLSSSIADSESY